MTLAVSLAVMVFGGAACGQSSSSPHSTVATTHPPPASSAIPPPSGPLSAPKASVAQDGQFFTYVTEADPALVTYEQQQGNVALRALLTVR